MFFVNIRRFAGGGVGGLFVEGSVVRNCFSVFGRGDFSFVVWFRVVFSVVGLLSIYCALGRVFSLFDL